MLTVKQVASRLNVSPGTVYGLVNRGRLHAFRIGVGRGTLRIPEESIGEFLQSTVVDRQPARVAHTACKGNGSPFTHLDASRLRRAWREAGLL